MSILCMCDFCLLIVQSLTPVAQTSGSQSFLTFTGTEALLVSSEG